MASPPPPARAACTDAERRFALARLVELRAAGRAAVLEAEWVRPRTELAAALHAMLGVAASLVAVTQPLVGVVLAFLAVVSATSDAISGPALLRRLTPRRATQSVLAPGDPGAPVVRARLDAPRGGLGARLPFGPVVPFALLGILVAAIVRGLDIDDRWVAIAQLVPTALALLAVAAFLDVALGAPRDDLDATQAAVAAGLATGATVLLHGAGDAGRSAHLRRHRPPAAVRWIDARPGESAEALAGRIRAA